MFRAAEYEREVLWAKLRRYAFERFESLHNFVGMMDAKDYELDVAVISRGYADSAKDKLGSIESNGRSLKVYFKEDVDAKLR